MEEKLTIYYIGFFKYDDSTFWQKTGLYKDKATLEEYIKTIPYCNSLSVKIKEFELPDEF